MEARRRVSRLPLELRGHGAGQRTLQPIALGKCELKIAEMKKEALQGYTETAPFLPSLEATCNKSPGSLELKKS
jgi:hypothetical protein